MRVLLAELAPASAGVASNLARVEEVLGSGPCDLAVFPELFLSGYKLGDRFHRLAIAPGGPEERRLVELARNHRTGVALGGPVRSALRPGEVENAALLVTPEGEVHRQGKRYLPSFGPFEEGMVFTPSPASHTFRLGPVSLGLEVCYDAFFPEVSRELALLGADVLVIVSAAPTGSRRLFEKILPARAVENACPLVYVNRVGVEDGLVFGGGSVAFDARGEPLEERPVPVATLAEGERVVEVDLDLTNAPRWRPFRPVLRDVASRPSTAPKSLDRTRPAPPWAHPSSTPTRWL